MGQGAAASVAAGNVIVGNGIIPKVDVEKMPLLSPFQLGPFSLSHRYSHVHGEFRILTVPESAETEFGFHWPPEWLSRGVAEVLF